MSLLGKLLIVTVLVMSVLFMTLGLTVYGTHTNLRSEADALDQQVSQQRAQFDELKKRYNRLDVQLEGELRSGLFQLRKLENELVSLRARNLQLHEELEELEERRGDATSRFAAAQEDNVRLGEQVDSLRSQIAENDDARRRAFQETLTATEQLHQLHGQLEKVVERNRQLATQQEGS